MIEEKFIGIPDEARRNPYNQLEYMVYDSGKEGPKIFLTSGAHGEEIGGVDVVHQLFKELRETPLYNGAVYAFPNMNPKGMIRLSHRLVPSREDLNRCFPGNPESNGSLGKRIAYIIFQEILRIKPDFVFDLHNDWKLSIPYAILEPCSDDLKDKEAYKAAEENAHNTDLLVIREREKVKGSLSLSLLEAGIPSITLELGESYVINHDNVRYGVGAIFNFMSSMGMADKREVIEYSSPKITEIKESRMVYEYYGLPFAKEDGTLKHLVESGQEVIEGQEIAYLIGINQFGKVIHTFRANKNGIVLGRRGDSVIRRGNSVMAFGVHPKNI